MKDDELFIGEEIPKRLSNKEILVLFDKMKQGDMEAREELITGNIELVINCVKNRFKDVCYDKQELVAIGFFGLIKAINTFDLSKHKYFSMHAGKYVYAEIEIFLNRVKKESNVLSFDEPFNRGTKLKNVLLDNVGIEEEYEDRDYDNYLFGLLKESMEYLSERDKQIIMLYFGFFDDTRYTIQEIAGKVGISSARVCKVISESLEKIKENAQRLANGMAGVRGRCNKKKTMNF